MPPDAALVPEKTQFTEAGAIKDVLNHTGPLKGGGVLEVREVDGEGTKSVGKVVKTD